MKNKILKIELNGINSLNPSSKFYFFGEAMFFEACHHFALEWDQLVVGD